MKLARKDYLRKWRRDNKKRIKRYYKDYYEKNRRSILIKHKYYKKVNKEKVALASYKYNLKKRFDLTLEDYQRMFETQSGCCAICGRHQSKQKQRLSVDHSHITGYIRGLLCRCCNAHLAWLENHRIDIDKYIGEK